MRYGLAMLGLVSLSAGPVEFNRDIRPIFSDKCYVATVRTRRRSMSHFVWTAKRPRKPIWAAAVGRLSKATRTPAVGAANGGLEARTTNAPASSGLTLSPAEIKTLRDWVAKARSGKALVLHPSHAAGEARVD